MINEFKSKGIRRTMVATGPADLAAYQFFPKPPQSIEESDLNEEQLIDLILKHLYTRGLLTGIQLSESIGLPLANVLTPMLHHLQQEHMILVRGADQGGLGFARYQFLPTEKGQIRAREALDRNGYVGVAPVSLKQYQNSVLAQTTPVGAITKSKVQEALSHLVLPDRVIRQLGPAANAGRTAFLWGAPGNGKTATAEALGQMMPGDIFVPQAIDVQGNTIPLYDRLVHHPVPNWQPPTPFDQRWVRVQRPLVKAGGELTLDQLDLMYDATTHTHRAPLQMKANNGVFLIDDFGRQAMPPQSLLNRWIMPLENKVDYLSLVTGHQIEIPFRTLILFSTNIDPHELVDEAFLRRIRYKINFSDPSLGQFREIFIRECEIRKIQYRDEALKYLLRKHYLPVQRPLRSCHPRDLLEQLIEIARFDGVAPTLDPDLLDDAATSYFVELSAPPTDSSLEQM